MKLKDALRNIGVDNNWAIYAQYPLSEDSECRYGRIQYENGGLLDDKEYIINGAQVNNIFYEQVIKEYGDIEYQIEVCVSNLINELNEEHRNQDPTPDRSKPQYILNKTKIKTDWYE